MIVTVNGERRQVADGSSLAEVVAAYGAPAVRGVAAAVGGDVVPRTRWDVHVLRDGDAVELVTAVQGG